MTPFASQEQPDPDPRAQQRREADRILEAAHPLEDAGAVDAALLRYREAVDVAPDYARAHMNVGNALRKLERFDDALAAYRKATQCEPDSPRARFNLGSLLFELDRFAEAEGELLEALRLDPQLADAAVVLADIYETTERAEQAEAQFERARALRPDHVGTLINYARFSVTHGHLDRATELFLHAKAIDPLLSAAESHLLWALNFVRELDPSSIAERHREIGLRIARVAGPPFSHWQNVPERDRKLRVGYLSGDFLAHPVPMFLRPVLQHHDPRSVETFLYSNYRHDNVIARDLRETSGHWRNVTDLTDRELADQLRSDGIDILVDLSGHTNRNRMPMLALHPAPVQITWLGYLNTTGLAAMDYRICDAHTDPPGTTEHLHTERLIRMPHSQWCYLPWVEVPPVDIPHPDRPDALVFGSFNQFTKISDACLDLWSRLLTAVPSASLVILDVRDKEVRKTLLRRLDRYGIDPARVTLRGRESVPTYFDAIGNADIALDTIPYNGGTTTLDTLWMGVPVVALRGDRGIARGTYSILQSLGARDLIANDADEYVEINCRLAASPEWRNRLRATLRDRMRASPLMNAPQFTADLESAYRTVWSEWCEKVNNAQVGLQGKPPPES
jgi:predicted O-linked N-acetylglucosamine transferase (SPINDLY family)